MTGRPSRATGRRAGGALLATGLLAAAAGACTDIPSDPSEPFSLAFDRLPFPAVVVDDVMRDATGAPAPLQALVYNVQGELIADAPVTWRVLDPGATVDAAGVLTGEALQDGTLPTGIRVLAEAGGLQSLPLRFDVVPRPDSLHLPVTTADTAEWGIPTTTDDRSALLEARVLHVPAAGEGEAAAEPVGVRSWVVRYALEVDGVPLASDSTALFWLVDDGNRRSAVDTTSDQGVAARRLRLNGNEAAALAGIANVVVIVTAEGAELRGEPGRITVPIRRRSTTP